MSDDDAAYHKSARNMALVLAAIVITVFAAIFVPPVLNPVHEQFAQSVTYTSPNGFDMYLVVNSTHLAANQSVFMAAWVNNTSTNFSNVTAADQWPLPGLQYDPCGLGTPFGIGILAGYYSSLNITLGTALSLPVEAVNCLASATPSKPVAFLFEPQSSTIIAKSPTGVTETGYEVNTSYSGHLAGGKLVPFSGVYTVVLADEWGDALVTHFSAG